MKKVSLTLNSTISKLNSMLLNFVFIKTCGEIFILKKMPQFLWQKNSFENFASKLERASDILVTYSLRHNKTTRPSILKIKPASDGINIYNFPGEIQVLM